MSTPTSPPRGKVSGKLWASITEVMAIPRTALSAGLRWDGMAGLCPATGGGGN
jgi:hypothetical protein